MNKSTFTPVLYYYEHCPYCVRVLTLLGLGNISVVKKVLLNDDEKTPTQMIGKKMLPILETSPEKYLAESLDIIDYLCQDSELILHRDEDQIKAVNDFLNNNRLLIHNLTMPRWSVFPFKEFETDGSISYFVEKKTKVIGDFDNALQNTALYEHELTEKLYAITDLLNKLQEDSHNIASIILFSGLYGLSIVENYTWTKASLNFMQKMSQEANLPLGYK